MNPNLLDKIVIIFLLFASFIGKSATCISTGNGNWATGATWSCGSTPTCGDSVIIQSGHTVTITSQQDLRGCGSIFRLVVRGTLRFTTGNKLRLACGSRVYVFGGGSIVPGGGGGSSNELEICGATMWQASDGTYTGPGCFPSTLTACAAVLPVELTIFEQVGCGQNLVCFRWATASEHNNNFFELERSIDGEYFRAIARIESKSDKGFSEVPLEYAYSDKEVFSVNTYYRLKQVDYDYRYSYSQIIVIDPFGDKLLSISISPNPNNGDYSLNILGSKPGIPVQLVISDFTGREIEITQLYPGETDFKSELVPGKSLLQGIYFFEVKQGERVGRTRVLVRN